MPATTPEVSLGELIRLAFPPETAGLQPAHRERPVAWVTVAGPGVTPGPRDFVLLGAAPDWSAVAEWAAAGVAGIAVPAATRLRGESPLPVVVLPPGAALRDIQQAALELIVNRQVYLAQRGALVAQTLTRRTLEGDGLPGLAGALADLTGKAVLVQDKRLQPLAEAVPGALAPGWPAVREALTAWSQLPENLRDRRQAATADWRDQALPGGLVRRVGPIVAKGMARGYLSVIGPAGELDALDQLAVEYGAAACALEMAKAKAVSEAEKRAHGDFLDAVLTASVPADELVRWAGRIGVEVEAPHAAQVWRWAEPNAEPGAPPTPSLRRLETLVNQSVAQQGIAALARPRGGEIVMFVEVPAADEPAAALDLAEAIRQAAALEYPRTGLYGGVGRPAGELRDWKDSYREASQAAGMASRLHEDRPLYFGHLSVYRLLFQMENSPELEAFCREALGPLLDYEGGGDLLETLEAYCERLGNLSQTAEKLYIHRNSLLYRMERIHQIAGLDMNNPDTRLAVHLALKVRKMLNPAARRKERSG